MIRTTVFALTLACAAPALSDVDQAVARHILPGLAGFAQTSSELARVAAQDCRVEAVAPAYHAAFDAWMSVGDIRIGPSETGAISVVFWPDDRGFTPRGLARLIANDDAIVDDPDEFLHLSIAARGFFALDMVLFDPSFSTYAQGDYTCRLVQAISVDLDRQASNLREAWTTDFAPILTTAGAEGNATFLTEDEAMSTVYTQLLASLELTADVRLARPMGSFERPRPKLAEARRSGRSLRNAMLSVEAVFDLAHLLHGGPMPRTDRAMEQVRFAASHIEDPAFQDVETPQARLRVEALQQAVRGLRDALEVEIGTELGIVPGFNANDGD